MNGETVTKKEMVRQVRGQTPVRECIVNAVGAAVLKKASVNGEVTTEDIGSALFELIGDEQMVELLSGEFGDRCLEVLKGMRNGKSRKNCTQNGVSGLRAERKSRVPRTIKAG